MHGSFPAYGGREKGPKPDACYFGANIFWVTAKKKELSKCRRAQIKIKAESLFPRRIPLAASSAQWYHADRHDQSMEEGDIASYILACP